MKKIWDDSILLISNRTDRKISPHMLSGMYFSNEDGYKIFELDQTCRDLANRRITIDKGCLFKIEEGTFMITDLSFDDKRPRRARCTTVPL